MLDGLGGEKDHNSITLTWGLVLSEVLKKN